MTFVCTTCDREFPDGIPDGAVQLTPGERRINTFRFADGTVHHLRKPMSTEQKHKIWHGKFPRPDCVYCNPPPEPSPSVDQVLLQEVVAAFAELPEPQPELPVEGLDLREIIEQEIEDESESVTTMGAAFKRLGK